MVRTMSKLVASKTTTKSSLSKLRIQILRIHPMQSHTIDHKTRIRSSNQQLMKSMQTKAYSRQIERREKGLTFSFAFIFRVKCQWLRFKFEQEIMCDFRRSSTRKVPVKQIPEPMKDDDDDGLTCSICLDSWEWEGKAEHRLVALKCGHLFGNSCIRR